MEEYTIEIIITGKEKNISGEDFDITLDEVVKKIKDGYYSGSDGNENETYSFSVKQTTNA